MCIECLVCFPNTIQYDSPMQPPLVEYDFLSCRVKHPNIVQLRELFDDKAKLYLVMEL